MIMKAGGFDQVVHDMFMQQPHELPWDNHNNITDIAIFPPAAAVAATAPPPTAARNELSEWVERVTRQLIDDMPAAADDDSDSSTMVHNNHNMGFVQNDNVDYLRPRKRANNNNVSEVVVDGSQNRTQSKVEEQGLSLISQLLECAVAISVDNLGESHRMLLELTQMASPYGPSCAERVVAYFAKAMSSRVINSWLGMCSPLVFNHRSIHTAFQLFNNVSPFVKFAHFTSNQAILEAFHRRDRVHIIDVDVMQGLQWPALFHILATRMEGPPHLRMTGMGASMDLLVETGKQLCNFAKRLGMSFEFHPVAKKFGEIDHPWDVLQVRRGETLAVHWLQHSLYDATGPDWKTMRVLVELAPRVMTLVEQDIGQGQGQGQGGSNSFLDRFVGSLHYYSTMFDSLGAYLGCDDENRHRIEHCLLHKEINNILAIGGPARSGEEKVRHWRSELGRNGFMQVPMSGNSMAQAQLILNMFPPAHGYSLVQGDGTLRLGWKDTSLYTASAWTSQAST